MKKRLNRRIHKKKYVKPAIQVKKIFTKFFYQDFNPYYWDNPDRNNGMEQVHWLGSQWST